MPGPVVSLIVPVHDAEAYLPECLASIAAQTVFDTIEVVLVDDGSTDGSPRIAADFAAAHPNVVLVSQVNAGPGAARNAGLDRSTADLITFMDSDDVLPERSIETRVAAMADPGVDLVVGGLTTFPDTRVWKWSRYFVPGETHVLDSLREHPDLVYNAAVWNKVFRRATVERLGLRFAVGRHFEDAWFCVPAVLDARRIVLIGDSSYLYRRHETSITANIFTRRENYDDHLVLVEHLLAGVGDRDPDEAALVWRFAAHAMSGFLHHAPEVLEGEDLAGFFARARAVLAPVPDEVLLDAFVYPAARIPFVALRTDRPELLDLDAAVASPLVVRDGAAYLDLGRPEDAELVRLRHPKAHLTGLSRGDDGTYVVDVELRTDVPAAIPLGAGLCLRAGTGDVLVPLTQTGEASARVRSLRGAIPASELEPGEHRLRVELVTSSGSLPIALRPKGDLRADDDDGDAVALDAKGRCLLVVPERKRRGLRARLRP